MYCSLTPQNHPLTKFVLRQSSKRFLHHAFVTSQKRAPFCRGRREVDDDASEVTPTAPSARATTSISKDVAARLQQLEQEEEDLGWGEDDATATVTVDLDVQEQVRDSEIVGAKPHDTQSNATTGHEEELSPLPQSRTFAAPEQNIGDEADHAASSNA